MGHPQQPHRRDYTPVWILAGTIVLMGLAVMATLVVLDQSRNTGGGTAAVAEQLDSPEQPEAQEPPQEEQGRDEATVKQVAQAAFDLYSSGQYGQFWDVWSSQAQASISRDGYVRLFELCKPIAENIRFTIQSVAITGVSAKVQANRLIGAFTFDFVYEGGRWRYVPAADQQQEYQSGTVEQVVEARKAKGTCAGSTPSFMVPTPTR
ncbi:hypothetical protein [Nonomuraea sp. NPDC050310]|uniref:hypothetical protein n=1 Tax=Nonomuraea sp. NPDC050310 TaxID=3154935 RepID=UPI00340481B4